MTVHVRTVVSLIMPKQDGQDIRDMQSFAGGTLSANGRMSVASREKRYYVSNFLVRVFKSFPLQSVLTPWLVNGMFSANLKTFSDH